MKTVLLIVAGVVVLALVVTGALAWRFAARVSAIEAELAASAPAAPREDLPPPVAAFARRGMLGAAPVGAVRIVQAVEMRLAQGADWQAMPAHQVDSMASSGFAWVAAQKLGPLPLVRVIDSYADAEGRLEVRLLGAWPLGVSEGDEASLGEGLRYVAELPFFPDAILTNRAISWDVPAEGLARAVLDTPGGPASVTFAFDSAGDIVSMQAERPANMPDGSTPRLEWRGEYGDYGELGGRRVPRSGEVGYVYPEGYEAYWRGTFTSYELLPPPR
jgi:hypothetical protein